MACDWLQRGWRRAVLTKARVVSVFGLWAPYVASLIITYVTLVQVQDGSKLPFYMWLLMLLELIQVFFFAGHILFTAVFGMRYPFAQGARFMNVIWIEGLSPLYSRISTTVLVTHVVAHSITLPMLINLKSERDRAEAAGLEVPVTKTLRIFLDEIPEDEKQKIGWAATMTYIRLIITLGLVFIRVLIHGRQWVAQEGANRAQAVPRGCSVGKFLLYCTVLAPFFASFVLTFVAFDIVHVEPFVYLFFAGGAIVEFFFFAWYVFRVMRSAVVFSRSSMWRLVICAIEGFALLYTVTRSTLLIAVLLFKGLTEEFVECSLPFLMSAHRPATDMIKCYWKTVPDKEFNTLVAVLVVSFVVELIINVLYILKQKHMYEYSLGIGGRMEYAAAGAPDTDSFFLATGDELDLVLSGQDRDSTEDEDEWE